MEEEKFEIVGKRHKLEVKISSSILNSNLISIEGGECIDMPEIIEQRFANGDEFIIFGHVGARRDLIEWYKITEI